jgi:hypothetical protein
MHAGDVGAEGQGTFYRYGVYGISLQSQVPFPLPRPVDSSFLEIELKIGAASLFSKALQGAALRPHPRSWFRHAQLEDGSAYVRWGDNFQFLVSADGREITCGWLGPASKESFQVYALGHALSFALVKRGLEPLHATSVVINGRAVAFLGRCGFGKSSLAASFLEAGYQLLTDDLLLLRKNGGGFYGYAGPPRIKLFPGVARAFLKENLGGVPMNSGTTKLVLPLLENQVCRMATPVVAICVLRSAPKVAGKGLISVAPLPPKEALLELLKGTFNRLLTGPERLERQFAAVSQLVAKVPVFTLSYPKVLRRLPEVRDAVLSELRLKQSGRSPMSN